MEMNRCTASELDAIITPEMAQYLPPPDKLQPIIHHHTNMPSNLHSESDFSSSFEPSSSPLPSVFYFFFFST